MAEPRRRGPATFRQRDVTAAVKAVKAAGDEIARVEIGKDGKIVIITSREAEVAREIDEWDRALS